MSECVVRMEMPESCKKCISTNCIWGKEGSDYLDVIAALQDFRKGNNAGFPDFCPIVCQLPEGHGRLVDIDRKFLRVATDGHGMSWNWRGSIAEMIDKDNMRGVEIIVPAERSET